MNTEQHITMLRDRQAVRSEIMPANIHAVDAAAEGNGHSLLRDLCRAIAYDGEDHLSLGSADAH
jgi:hypothetical protein